jgi:hypothetical protein
MKLPLKILLLSGFIALLVSSLLRAQGTLFQSLNLSTGLVAEWKLCGDTSASSGCNASNATAVYDSSGNGNNGSWSGTAAGSTGYYSAGHAGPWAGYFNAANDSISVNAASSINLSGSMTITAWIKTATTVRTSIVVGGYSGSQGYGFGIGAWNCTPSVGNLAFLAGGTWHCSTATVNDGNWHLIAVSLVSGSSINFYIDGALSQTNAYTSGIAAYAGNVGIGYEPGNPYFPGQIEDVRIYDRPLSAPEIAALAHAHN